MSAKPKREDMRQEVWDTLNEAQRAAWVWATVTPAEKKAARNRFNLFGQRLRFPK